MKINQISNNILYKNNNLINTKTTNNVVTPPDNKAKNNRKKLYQTAMIGATILGGIAIATIAINSKKRTPKEVISPYTQALATALSGHLNKKVEPKQLKSVISGNELLEELKGLKKENFVASEQNIKDGTFLADLHSHSNYSDGKGDVKNILDEVSNYADKLYQKNGKKFIYALTDHDTSNGVKEALTIISEDPDKYKNVKFVTGAEMSFAIKSDKTSNPYETIEVLAYGFNPFDKKISTYMDNIHKNRHDQAKKFISDLQQRFGYADFSQEEFEKTYGIKKDFVAANNQWKVHHYGQTKNAIAGLANSQGKDKPQLYQEIMSKTDEKHMALGNLRDAGLVPQSYGDDSNITKLCKEVYSPHKNSDGTFNPASENKFEDIVDTFKDQDNTFLAFAHPYYITERTSKPQELVSDLVSKSKGLLKASEEHHQAYKNANIDGINKINHYISDNHHLISLGGRDNHEANWLPG